MLTLTPLAALTEAVTVTWAIIGVGRLPTSTGDFPSLSGSGHFVAAGEGAKTITITPSG